jgi:hypothetical protein
MQGSEFPFAEFDAAMFDAVAGLLSAEPRPQTRISSARR